MNILILLALAIILGTGGARIFKWLRIPQVVAYVLIGTLLGPSVSNLLPPSTVRELEPLTYLALGVIGFTIGGELRISVFKKYGRSTTVILLAEGLAAFAIVAVVVGFFTGNWPLAVLLGAISSATAPAATVAVLWEYKAAGVLTTMVFAIVALDDGLALLLYGFASSIAKVLLSSESISLSVAVGLPLYEILGSSLLGIVIGVALRQILRVTRERELILGFALGSILLAVGLSELLDVDLILAAMFAGATFVNLVPRQAGEVFDMIRRFSPPIYTLFFVLAGARLVLSALEGWMIVTAVLFVVGRTVGKFVGSYIGARLSSAADSVRRYLGLCLFSQAGVAIGLAILASHTFEAHPLIATTIVGVITTTTFLVQIIGPPCVKLGIAKAGEVGRNVTEEDLLISYKVRDVMDKEPVTFAESEPLGPILDKVARSEATAFPVLTESDSLAGVIRLTDLRYALNAPTLGSLVIASELMQPVSVTGRPGDSLKDALQLMRERDMDFLPVTEGKNGKLAGILGRQRVQRLIADEVVRRHRELNM
jgi:Kef-type K+ transport system membrane component KefB